mgnify:CR=1 FL=1
MNLNDFALRIAKEEGKLKQVDIAQIKEIMKIMLTQLASLPLSEIVKVLNRYKSREV